MNDISEKKKSDTDHVTPEWSNNKDGSITISCKYWCFDLFQKVRNLLDNLPKNQVHSAESLFAAKVHQFEEMKPENDTTDMAKLDADISIAETIFWCMARLRHLDADSKRALMLKHVIEYELPRSRERMFMLLDPQTESMHKRHNQPGNKINASDSLDESALDELYRKHP